MFAGSGSSSRPLLSRRGSSSPVPTEIMIPPEDEPSVWEQTVDSPKQVSVSRGRPKCRPLSIFDDYEIVSGVPTFLIKSETHFQCKYRCFAISTDGSKLAVATTPTTICVYDLSDGCSLIAKGEDMYDGDIEFLSFWDNQDDKLVVLSDAKVVVFVCIIEEPCTPNDRGGAYHGEVKGLQIEQALDLKRCSDDNEEEDVCCDNRSNDPGTTLHDFFVCGSTMWIAEKGKSGADSIRIAHVTSEEVIWKDVHQESVTKLTDMQLFVGRGVALITDLSNATDKRESAFMWNISGSGDNTGQRSEIINGRCIAWDRVEYVVTWDLKDNGATSVLNLYSGCPQDGRIPELISCTDLRRSIIDVRAAFLNRESWCGDEVGTCETPLICLLEIKRNEVDFLVWDPNSKKILRRIEASPKEVGPIGENRIEFTVSPDGKWFVVGDLWNGNISLFSVMSRVLVWSTTLILWSSESPHFLPFVFHSWGSKFVVNGAKALNLFMPPCLIQDHKIDLSRVTFKLNEETERGIPRLDERHLRLFYKTMVSSMRFYRSTEGSVDISKDVLVATDVYTGRVAMAIRDERCPRIVFSHLRDTCSSLDKNLAIDFLKGQDNKHACQEIRMTEEFISGSCPFCEYTHMFMYSNREGNGECIAALKFGTQEVTVLFVDLTKCERDLRTFERGEIFACFQGMESSKVMCLKQTSILVMDLEEKDIVGEVLYGVHLPSLIETYERERHLTYHQESRKEHFEEINQDSAKRHSSQFLTSPHITGDGEEVLLGWSTVHKKPMILTPNTSGEEIDELIVDRSIILPCWALDKTFQFFSFIEFDKASKRIKCLGIYDSRNEKCIKFQKEDWTGQMARLFEQLDLEVLISCEMRKCEDNGCVWIMTSAFDALKRLEINLLPIQPYLAKDCIPSFYVFNESPTTSEEEIMSESMSRFEESLFNMSFNGKTNLQLAIECKDVRMIDAFSKCAHTKCVQLGMHCHHEELIEKNPSLLEIAIKQKKEDVVRAILRIHHETQIPFGTSAMILRKNFKDVWDNNRIVCEEMLIDDMFSWNMFTLDVPSIILDNDAYRKVRVGSCEEQCVWKKTSRNEPIEETLRVCDSSANEQIEEIRKTSMVQASMKVFCIEDACKIDLDGILRFLLSKEAPSHLFKTPLVKWIIIWKWEHIWKHRSRTKLWLFSVLLATFTTYTICLGFHGSKLQNTFHFQVILTLLLVVMGCLTLVFLVEEVQQLRSYIKDGKNGPNGACLEGVKRYFDSKWNILELITYAILVFLVVPLHCLSFAYTWHFQAFYIVLAVETLLIWIKVWYFGQSFAKTGALVLMIENVVKDCIPFLFLAGIILLGFSIAMFMLFRERINHIHSNDPEGNDGYDDGHEIFEKIVSSFDSPWKAMRTMFFAMIGAFDIEVYSNGGTLSPIIAMFFVLYLSIQAIVMFNMLIALMSDTFDRVKSTEEEQLLLGRARFIDACEAALDDDEIDKMNEKIGKYLYVLFPKDEKQSKEATAWHGRVRTIDDNVRRTVEQYHGILLKKFDDIKQGTNGLEASIKRIENEIATFTKRFDEINETRKIPDGNAPASPSVGELDTTGSPSNL